MQKIATCIASTSGADLVTLAIDLCHKHGIDLNSTRIGRSATPTQGWFPCVIIVQEHQHVAEQIEVACALEAFPCWHIQGEPTKGTVQTYTGRHSHTVYKYSDKPQGLGQIIEYNGNTIYVY